GFAQSAPDRVDILQPDVGQDQVLFVGGANLVEREACGQVGDDLHLSRRYVAGDPADRFQRDDDGAVAGLLVLAQVRAGEAGELGVQPTSGVIGGAGRGQVVERRRREIALDAGQLLVGDAQV